MKWEQLMKNSKSIIMFKMNKKPGCNKAKQTLINAET